MTRREAMEREVEHLRYNLRLMAYWRKRTGLDGSTSLYLRDLSEVVRDQATRAAHRGRALLREEGRL